MKWVELAERVEVRDERFTHFNQTNQFNPFQACLSRKLCADLAHDVPLQLNTTIERQLH